MFSVIRKYFCLIRKITFNFQQTLIRCLYYEPIKTDSKQNLLYYLMIKQAVHKDSTALSIITFIGHYCTILTRKSIFKVKYNFFLINGPSSMKSAACTPFDNGLFVVEIFLFFEVELTRICEERGRLTTFGKLSIHFNNF